MVYAQRPRQEAPKRCLPPDWPASHGRVACAGAHTPRSREQIYFWNKLRAAPACQGQAARFARRGLAQTAPLRSTRDLGVRPSACACDNGRNARTRTRGIEPRSFRQPQKGRASVRHNYIVRAYVVMPYIVMAHLVKSPRRVAPAFVPQGGFRAGTSASLKHSPGARLWTCRYSASARGFQTVPITRLAC